MAVGVYWFSYARSVDEAKKEAEACLEVIKAYKNRITLPVFFDFEYDSEEYAEKAGVTVDRRFVTDVTRAFCETIRSAGYIAGYYTNQDYYKNKLYPEELADYDLWLADYTGGPEYTCAIQQFTSTGKVNGISGNVDMNVAFKEYGSKPTSSSKKYGTCTGDGVRIRPRPTRRLRSWAAPTRVIAWSCWRMTAGAGPKSRPTASPAGCTTAISTALAAASPRRSIAAALTSTSARAPAPAPRLSGS